MRHKLVVILANTVLLSVVLVLLAGPLLFGQLLGAAQSGALGVQDMVPVARSIQVVSNSTDFANYATFNPSPVVEPLFYQTSVTFTAFGGQQAAYNGLLTIVNPGTEPVQVGVEAGRLSGQTDGATVLVSLSDDKHAAVTLTTAVAKKGATALKVADASGFTDGTIVIGDSSLTAKRLNETTFSLDKPLNRDINVGEKVYMGSAYFAKQSAPKIARTQEVTIPPKGRAVVTLVVALEEGDEQQQIVLPLTVTAR